MLSAVTHLQYIAQSNSIPPLKVFSLILHLRNTKQISKDELNEIRPKLFVLTSEGKVVQNPGNLLLPENNSTWAKIDPKYFRTYYTPLSDEYLSATSKLEIKLILRAHDVPGISPPRVEHPNGTRVPALENLKQAGLILKWLDWLLTHIHSDSWKNQTKLNRWRSNRKIWYEDSGRGKIMEVLMHFSARGI